MYFAWPPLARLLPTLLYALCCVGASLLGLQVLRLQALPLHTLRPAPHHASLDAPLRVYAGGSTPGMVMYQIPHACVSSNGSVLVPESLAPLEPVIGEHGRVGPALAFYDPVNDPDMHDPALTRRHAGVHIIGTRPLRAHMPHFVEDLVAHTFPMMRHFQRQMDDPPVLPTVLVDEQAKSWRWDMGLLGMLRRQTTTAPLQAMYSGEMFPPERSSGDVRHACFDSVSVLGGTAPRNVYPNSVIDPETVDEILGHLPPLVRDTPPLPTNAACHINVTIINRPLAEKMEWLSEERRRIINVQDIADALTVEAKRLDISVAIAVREDFDAASFQDQFDLMQQTHSIVAVHGAELANLLFVRKGTSLVEVLPFRYVPFIFEHMATSVGANHVAFLADPDMDSFEKCLRATTSHNPDWLKDTESAIEDFRADAAAYFEAKAAGNPSSVGMSLDHGSGHFASVRKCMRQQRLVVSDAKLIAMEALRNHSQWCHVSPNRSPP